MGDTGDDFRAMKEARKADKEIRIQRAKDYLDKNKIPYDRPHSWHFVVNVRGNTCDVWPGTGKWSIRGVELIHPRRQGFSTFIRFLVHGIPKV